MSANRRVTDSDAENFVAVQLIEIRTLDPAGDWSLSGFTPHIWLRVELWWQTRMSPRSILQPYEYRNRMTNGIIRSGFSTCAGCDGDVQKEHVRIPGRDRPFCTGCVLRTFEVRPLR